MINKTKKRKKYAPKKTQAIEVEELLARPFALDQIVAGVLALAAHVLFARVRLNGRLQVGVVQIRIVVVVVLLLLFGCSLLFVVLADRVVVALQFTILAVVVGYDDLLHVVGVVFLVECVVFGVPSYFSLAFVDGRVGFAARALLAGSLFGRRRTRDESLHTTVPTRERERERESVIMQIE